MAKPRFCHETTLLLAGWAGLFGICVGGCNSGQAPASEMPVAPANSATGILTSDSRSTNVGTIAYEARIEGAPLTFADVRFFAGASPKCTVEIVERSILVAANDHLVECGLLGSPKMLDVEIAGDKHQLRIFQQLPKGTNTYTLRKESSGWVITKVELVYSRDNLASGEVEVVRKTADLRSAPIDLSRFSPAALAPLAVESLVQ